MRYAKFFLLLPLLVAAPAPALMLEAPLEATTAKAAEIVRGEVVGRSSDWSPDNQTIWTDVVIRVDAALKGGLKAGQTITVRIEGGEIGDIGIRVQHQPRFLDNEKVLLFLREAGWNHYEVQNAIQGKFTVFDQVAYDYRGRRHELNELQRSIRYAIDQDQR